MRSAHCGSPHGVYLHKQAGEPPCGWCARVTTEPAGEPMHRHYITGGVIIGTDRPNAALRHLLDAGQARELADTELQQILAERGG